MSIPRPSAATGVLRWLLVLVVALAAAACGAGDTGSQEWRGLDLRLPDGWEVFERRDTLLSVADAPLGDEAGDPGRRSVAAQFTYDPSTSADDWRELIRGEGGEVESDERIELDGVPATRLVFHWTTNGIPTREMLVTVPSRSIVILFQPVPVAGQTDAPDVFLAKADDFQAILDSIRFGAPVDGR